MLKKLFLLNLSFFLPSVAFANYCPSGERLIELREQRYSNNNVVGEKVYTYCGTLYRFSKVRFVYDGRNTLIMTYMGRRILNKQGALVFESLDTYPSYYQTVPGDQVPNDVE
jgi:hypothetical protein